MTNADDGLWLPLEEAAASMHRKIGPLKSQMRNGRITRDVHFRSIGEGRFELNVTEYLRWVDEQRQQRKLPLLDRLRLDDQRGLDKIGPAQPKPMFGSKPDAITRRRRPKLIPVSVWAEETFGEYGPARNTLRNWIHAGKIVPFPIKVGREYFCSPDARYFDPRAEKINRLIEGR